MVNNIKYMILNNLYHLHVHVFLVYHLLSFYNLLLLFKKFVVTLKKDLKGMKVYKIKWTMLGFWLVLHKYQYAARSGTKCENLTFNSNNQQHYLSILTFILTIKFNLIHFVHTYHILRTSAFWQSPPTFPLPEISYSNHRNTYE